jgi:hypothetical protein
MSDKFTFQEGDAHRVENRELDCRGCALAYEDNVSECVAFIQKPLQVLKGNVCRMKRRAAQHDKG